MQKILRKMFSTIVIINLNCRLSIFRSILTFIHTYLEDYGFETNKKIISILNT